MRLFKPDVAKMREKKDVPGLIRALVDKDRQVRDTAAYELGQIGDARALPGLTAALQDADPSVRARAARALGSIGKTQAMGPLLGVLRDTAECAHIAAAHALAKMGAPALEPLIAALQDKEARRAAAVALGVMRDPRAGDPLLLALRDECAEAERRTAWAPGEGAARQSIVWALGELDDRRAIEPLLALLSDRDLQVRRSAVETLRKLADPRAVEPFTATVREALQTGYWFLAYPALLALGEIGDPGAVELSLAALADKNTDAREAAVRALKMVPDARAVEPLIRALGDAYWSVRAGAAEALGAIGDQRAILPLVAALKDQDGRVRDAAARALGPKAEKLRAVRRYASQLDDILSDRQAAFDALFASLQSDDPHVRALAAQCLADAPSALQRLISIYNDCRFADRRRALLAARVLGRRLAAMSDDAIPAEITRLRYGLPIAFIQCSCAHCGHFNKAIPAPPQGPMVPYYSQKDEGGAHSVPVLCDGCGREFFVVWDSSPFR